MTGRDERLGEVLRRLDVPDHRPDFFARLARRLEEGPVDHEPGDGEPGDDVPAASRRSRPWPRPPILLFAAAAVVLVLFGMSTLLTGHGTGPPQRSPSGTRLISATEVRARVSTALSSLRTLAGEVAVECAVNIGECAPADAGGRTTLRWTFAATAAGDERITGIGRQDEVAYSAAGHEQRAISGGRPGAVVISNLPPGPPDQAARRSVLRRNVASVVRAFLDTTGDVPVIETTEQGRPAWQLAAPVTPNKLAGPGASGDQLEVVVDRETGFPLRVTETLAGRFLDEVRLTKLVVDGPVDPALFLLDVPKGVQPLRSDAGFRAVALGDVEAAVGYRPLLPAPASLPAGYRLAEITVAPQAQATGSEGANPQSRNVVSVAYRRGFDRIVVTTRATGTASRCSTTRPGSGTTACWSDPVATGEGELDQPERFSVGGGALAGAQAEVVVSPRGVPHVWTIDPRVVVTVSGDATAEELHRMAQSFAPAG